MIDVDAPHRPRVKRDRAHLRGPAHHGELGRAHLIGVPAGGELDPRGLDVVGSALRDPLLVEGVAATLLPRRDDDAGMDALRPALERRRPAPERPHDPVADRRVVLDDLELGDLGRALRSWEDHPPGVGHAQLSPLHVDRRRFGAGHPGRMTDRAGATPTSTRGWG
jgi:hypothetical protein